MTSFSNSAERRRWRLAAILPYAFIALIPLLFVATMARTPVAGDPSEYTFVAHVLGVAHPPGYAFMTLFSKLFQLLIPIGTIAWRTHFVGVVGGTIGVLCVIGMVNALAPKQTATGQLGKLVAAFAGAITAFAANHWQHSIHANPHILTAAFLALNLFTLTKWYVSGDANQQGKRVPRNAAWLYAFCLSAGFGATHHPLTAFALPACVVFVLAVHPRILLDWKTLLKGTAFVLLGLLVWLYFPLRAPALVGSQFVSNMDSLDGFLDLILARGLRVNLNAFGLSDQWDRLTVFWTLLRVQHTLPIIFLALLGVVSLALPRRFLGEQHNPRPLLLLYLGAFVGNYLFVMNTVQDVMAYLLGPFLIVGLLAGIGLLGLLNGLLHSRIKLGARELGLLLALLFVAGPGVQLVRNGLHVSLAGYSEGVDYVAAVRAHFAGSNEGAVILNDWEHMTPTWYAMLVEEEGFDSTEITPIFVSAAKPWVELVQENLSARPVYLSRFERSIFDAGYRLRPRGAQLWQVVDAGDTTVPSELTSVSEASNDGAIEIVAYDIPTRSGPTMYPSELHTLVLAMRAPSGTADIYMPVLHIGDNLTMPFTTDGHRLSNDWLPGEMIVEAFDFVLPPRTDWEGGEMVVRVHNLSQNVDTGIALDVGSVLYGDLLSVPNTRGLIGNFRQRVGLAASHVRIGLGQQRRGVWDAPIYAKTGETIHISLDWRVLQSPEDSYTVFLHLIDLGNRPIIDTLDYTPLGGATPSHLWFPKWLPGQQMRDPYQMPLDGIAPGEYLIEVGLYEQFTSRRLHTHDAQGNVTGDRIILGKVIVE